MPKFEDIYKGPSKDVLKEGKKPPCPLDKKREKTSQEELGIMGYSFDSEGNFVLDEAGRPIISPKGEYYDPTTKKYYTEISTENAEIDEDKLMDPESGRPLEKFEEIDIIAEIRTETEKGLNDKFNKAMLERPEFSKEEKVFMEDFFNKWFKKHLSGESFLTKKKELELIAEFKEALPEKYAQIVNRRVLPENIKWTKEMFKDRQGKVQEGLVSYYPDKQNSVIKYVLKTKGKPIIPNSEKFFASHFTTDGKGRVVIFCEEIKKKPFQNVINTKSPALKNRFKIKQK